MTYDLVINDRYGVFRHWVVANRLPKIGERIVLENPSVKGTVLRIEPPPAPDHPYDVYIEEEE